jgi:hypothetical protein
MSLDAVDRPSSTSQPQAGRRSDRAYGETQVIIIPDDHEPIDAGHMREQTSGTPQARMGSGRPWSRRAPESPGGGFVLLDNARWDAPGR